MHATPYLYRYAPRPPGEDLRTIEERLSWLSAGERQVHAGLRDPRRREAFCGRILAKRLVLVQYRASLRLGAALRPADIDIDSGLARQRRECPRVKVAGRLLPWSMSIAHTPRAVLVAVGRTPGVRVGVDMVEPAPLPQGFSEVWFTAAERCWLQNAPQLAATLWAIKEAVYKAVAGERPFAPRTIEVWPHPQRGFVSRPACVLAVWRTPQGQTAVVAHTFNNCVQGEIHD